MQNHFTPLNDIDWAFISTDPEIRRADDEDYVWLGDVWGDYKTLKEGQSIYGGTCFGKVKDVREKMQRWAYPIDTVGQCDWRVK